MPQILIGENHTALDRAATVNHRRTRRGLALLWTLVLLCACLVSACGGGGNRPAQAPSRDDPCLSAPLNGPQPRCTPTIGSYHGPQGTSTTPPSGGCDTDCGEKLRKLVEGKP
jgi:hypothetical protein